MRRTTAGKNGALAEPSGHDVFGLRVECKRRFVGRVLTSGSSQWRRCRERRRDTAGVVGGQK